MLNSVYYIHFILVLRRAINGRVVWTLDDLLSAFVRYVEDFPFHTDTNIYLVAGRRQPLHCHLPTFKKKKKKSWTALAHLTYDTAVWTPHLHKTDRLQRALQEPTDTSSVLFGRISLVQ